MNDHRLRELLGAGPELPWSDWAMTPAGLASACAEIERADRREIVELGSGVSTIVIARLLRHRGAGRLAAVEHDADWAGWVRSQLATEGLADLASAIVAPLADHPLARDGARWYEESALGDLPASVDLLIVDGPPADLEGMEEGRYPALPVLAERLSANAAVILDDIDRAGEQAILGAWERESPFRFERLDAARVAIGRRQG
jgi:predicted O-methyltransferase YrrM